MLTALAIALVIMLAISVGAVEYADRQRDKQRRAEANVLRAEIDQATRQHKPRGHLYRRLVEIRRKELAQ